MRRKYTFLELMFSDKWQWVRKLSKCLWVKEDGPWIKFEQDELDRYGHFLDLRDMPDRRVEDWRESVKK